MAHNARVRRNSIESSPTFRLLVEMGFNSQTSFKATKMYFNDIESAVNYCSSTPSPSVSDSETDNTVPETVPLTAHTPVYYQPGSHFAQCYDMLVSKYSTFADIFNQWFREEEFEDSQLLDEFVISDGYDESFFIQYLEELYTDTNTPINAQLLENIYLDLVCAVNPERINFCDNPKQNIFETAEMKVIDYYIRSLQSIANPICGLAPIKVFLLCQKFYAKPISLTYSKSWISNEQTLYDNRELYAQQCDTLCHNILFMSDKYLLQLFTIGKRNNLPLLTYLVDAYNRFNIQQFKRVKRESQSYFGPYSRQIMQYERLGEFKKKNIKTFVSEALVNDSLNHFRKMCVCSMRYLLDGRRMCKPTICGNSSVHRINDSIIDYTQCIFESYSFVEKYISKVQNCGKMPLQFDVWIIPNKVSDTNGQNIEHNIGDIDRKLLANGCKYLKTDYINCDSEGNISAAMHDTASQLLQNKSNQRCCLIMDRRNKFNNKLYTYQLSNSDTLQCGELDTFVNESMFNNSIKCILPQFGGVKEEANGFMFGLSFHCISKYEVRVYLFLDTFGTRFFKKDIRDYLPQFFVERQSKLLDEFVLTNDFRKRYRKSGQLCDAKFEQFYQLLLQNGNALPY